MSSVHFHLMLVHFPVAGIFLALSLLALALFKRSEELKRVALIGFVVVGLSAVPVYFTGTNAEETVEHLAGVSEPVLEQHEEIAEVAIFTAVFLAVVSIVGLAIFRNTKTVPAWFMLSVLILAFLNAGIIGYTANLGGQIRHSEIRTVTNILEHSEAEED